MTIVDNTTDSNGGGIYIDDNEGIIKAKNTIIADNVAADTDNDVYESYGKIYSFGHNLVEAPGTSDTFVEDGDITGQDPLLDTLADNDGVTFTHALLAGSPAIGAGISSVNNPVTVDQRGYTRGSMPSMGGL